MVFRDESYPLLKLALKAILLEVGEPLDDYTPQMLQFLLLRPLSGVAHVEKLICLGQVLVHDSLRLDRLVKDTGLF